MADEGYHRPVLLDETLSLLVTDNSGTYLDGTLGGGGHFMAIAGVLNEKAVLIGLDRDPDAIAWTKNRIAGCRSRIILENSVFSQFDKVLQNYQIPSLNGALFDLGVSSYQIDKAERGFTYRAPSQLDMRMNPTHGQTAAELIETSDEKELARILGEYGEVFNPSRMARALKIGVDGSPVKTSNELKKCLSQEYGHDLQPKILSKVFQALRIAVNDELNELSRVLNKMVGYLAIGGRIAIIAYHSLEDRIVKEFFAQQENPCTCPPHAPICICNKKAQLKRITRKAVQASSDEIAVNVRARSARLRVAERV